MSTLTTILTILVALEHLYIMFLETIATSSKSILVALYGSLTSKPSIILKQGGLAHVASSRRQSSIQHSTHFPINIK